MSDPVATWAAVAEAWRAQYFALPGKKARLLNRAVKLWREACEAFPEHAPESHKEYLRWNELPAEQPVTVRDERAVQGPPPSPGPRVHFESQLPLFGDP